MCFGVMSAMTVVFASDFGIRGRGATAMPMNDRVALQGQSKAATWSKTRGAPKREREGQAIRAHLRECRMSYVLASTT